MSLTIICLVSIDVMCQNLISHGADIEARNAMDRTPLMSAARAGNIDVLRLLLDKGEGCVVFCSGHVLIVILQKGAVPLHWITCVPRMVKICRTWHARPVVSYPSSYAACRMLVCVYKYHMPSKKVKESPPQNTYLCTDVHRPWLLELCNFS